MHYGAGRIDWAYSGAMQIELDGWRAKLGLYAVIALIACFPAACAFFAYAEGRTSLWAAIAFTVVTSGGAGLYLCWDSILLRSRRRGSRPGERKGQLGEDRQVGR
jgi:hypothetical protein